MVLYAGNHGKAQALGPVVHAFAHPDPTVRAHLVLVGGGVEKSRLQEIASGSDRVHFLDPVPQSAVGELMADADAQLVSLADDALFDVTMPSKVQAALAAGRPVLGSVTGDAARVVEEAGAGVTCRPGDRAALMDAIARLSSSSVEDRAAMGARAAEHYRTHMSRAVGAARLTSILRAAASDRHASRVGSP